MHPLDLSAVSQPCYCLQPCATVTMLDPLLLRWPCAATLQHSPACRSAPDTDAVQAREPTTFIIDETFGVPGVGTVVAGTLKGGVITTGASLLLGPDLADGSFKPTAIKSIAYKRLAVNKVRALNIAAAACLLCCFGARHALLALLLCGLDRAVMQVVAGQTAALALKKVKRGAVRKGMVLVDASLRPQVSC